MFGSYVNLRYHMMSDGYCEVTEKIEAVKFPSITSLFSLHNFISQ